MNASVTHPLRGAIMALLVLLVPALLFANVYFSFRHNQLEQELARLEREQAELIEANKRALLAISVLRSPRRVGQLAEEELKLERIDPEQVDVLSVGGEQ